MPTWMQQFEREFDSRKPAGIAIAAMLGMFLSPPAQAADTTAATANPASSDALEQIVVSANRHAERLQDVGTSVTVESAQKLEELNIVRAEDLQKLAPGLAAIPNNGSAVSSFSIRGLSQADSSEHEEQPVAIYVDGTYIAVPAATGFPIYDVDHVEVLRGPQGTLFGRNATGGSVQFFSAQPTPDFSGSVAYTGGDYNLHRVTGYLNGGNDDISDRFAYYLSEHGGYVKNLSGPNLQSDQVNAFRNQTKFRLGENTTATLRLEHWQENGTSQNWQNASYTPPGSHYDANYGVFTPNLYGYVNPSSSHYVEAVNNPGEIYKRSNTVALNIQHDLADITFYSSTSYIGTKINYVEDTDGTPDNAEWYTDGGTAQNYEQEFRLAKTTGPFRWTTGVNYLQYKGEFFVSFVAPTVCDPTSTTDCLTALAGSAHLPLTNAGKGAQDDTAYNLNYKSYSGFAQVEYDFTERLTGILGGRYTYDDQSFDWGFNCLQTIASACETIFGVPQGFAGSQNYARQVVLSQTNGLYSYKAQLNYKFTPDLLAYLSFNRGTKSGGYFDATAGNVPPSDLSFKPEVLYSTELGIKSQFFDRRLTVNADYYHYDYKNSQQFNFAQGIDFTVVNLPAKSNGSELEATFRATPTLTFNLGAAYNDIHVSGVLPYATSPLTQERPVDAPVWQGTWGLAKDVDFKDLKFTFAYNGRYTGNRYFALINQPVVFAGGYTVQDVSIRVSTQNGLWVEGWVNNFANRDYPTAQFDNTYFGYNLYHVGAPRTGGVTVGIKF